MIPWRREWLPTPVFLPGEFHGQRSLAGYTPWGLKELDTAEGLTHRHTHSMQGLSGTPICQPYTPRALPRLLTSPAGYFNEASLALALYVFSLFWVIQAMTEHLD